MPLSVSNAVVSGNNIFDLLRPARTAQFSQCVQNRPHPAKERRLLAWLFFSFHFKFVDRCVILWLIAGTLFALFPGVLVPSLGNAFCFVNGQNCSLANLCQLPDSGLRANNQSFITQIQLCPVDLIVKPSLPRFEECCSFSFSDATRVRNDLLNLLRRPRSSQFPKRVEDWPEPAHNFSYLTGIFICHDEQCTTGAEVVQSTIAEPIVAIFRAARNESGERSGVGRPVPRFCTGKLTHAARQLSTHDRVE